MKGWYGVDLDGTLAHYESWGEGTIGPPIPLMVERVKRWLAEGREVRIFTARVSVGPTRTDEVVSQRALIQEWCKTHIGQSLDVTCRKDYAMVCLYDDRCRQVVSNTGELVGEE